MFELPVTATRSIKIPTVRLNQPNCLADFQREKAAPSRRTTKRFARGEATGLNPSTLQPFDLCEAIRVNSWLLLVGGNFGQLRREEAFLFFPVQRQTRGRDDARADEDDQVLFAVLFDVDAKGSANERNVADNGNLILSFLHVLAQNCAI